MCALCLWSCWLSEAVCLSFHVPLFSLCVSSRSLPPMYVSVSLEKAQAALFKVFKLPEEDQNHLLPSVRISFNGILGYVFIAPLRLLTSCLLPCFHIAGCIFSVPEDTKYVERKVEALCFKASFHYLRNVYPTSLNSPWEAFENSTPLCGLTTLIYPFQTFPVPPMSIMCIDIMCISVYVLCETINGGVSKQLNPWTSF